jgi:hypothetical protein
MKEIYIAFIIIFAVISCNDKRIFTGETVIYEFPDIVDTLYSEEVVLNDIFTGRMCAYDSLLLFFANFPDNSSWVFNVKTGEHISSIIPKGQGPDEFIMPVCTGQFEIDTNICVWVSDWSRNKFNLIDVMDNTAKKNINLAGTKNARNEPFGAHFYLNDSLVLLHNQEEMSHTGEIAPPIYRIFNYITKAERVRYEPHRNYRSENPFCLISHHLIKPDKSKFALASFFCHILIIIDLQSHKITGYGLKDTPGFEDIIHVEDADIQYHRMCVDDKFIYCATSVDEHVMMEIFDWEGTLTRRLLLKNEKTEDMVDVTFDPVNKILYVINSGISEGGEEKLHKYDVSYLYSK